MKSNIFDIKGISFYESDGIRDPSLKLICKTIRFEFYVSIKSNKTSSDWLQMVNKNVLTLKLRYRFFVLFSIIVAFIYYL